ncbi:MAG: hypothetical protein ACYDD0_09615 [Candidatus Dormibacteria bacterium]
MNTIDRPDDVPMRVGGLAWGDLPPSKRVERQELLLAWVREVLLPGWPIQTEPLVNHPCFPHHTDVVLDLRSAAAQFEADFYPDTTEDGSAIVGRLVGLREWVTDLGKASERWAASFKSCDSKSCARLSPPDYQAGSREKWFPAVMAAVETAWGGMGEPPPRAREPWETVAAVADYEAGRNGDFPVADRVHDTSDGTLGEHELP